MPPAALHVNIPEEVVSKLGRVGLEASTSSAFVRTRVMTKGGQVEGFTCPRLDLSPHPCQQLSFPTYLHSHTWHLG